MGEQRIIEGIASTIAPATVTPTCTDAHNHTPLQPFTTGYPESFLAALHQQIVHACRHDESGALLLLTIDNLAMAISAFGGGPTEDMLRHIHQTISSYVGLSDAVTRVQRDQFAIVLHGASAEEATYLGNRITSYIHQMGNHWTAQAIHLKGSVVQVSFPSEARSSAEVLEQAYLRQCGAERLAPSSVPAFDLRQRNKDRETMNLANYLNKAIIEDRLLMALQPVIDARTGAVVHHEALLRMRSDDGQISSAGALIPIAERMGLIETIDLLVLERTAAMLLAHPQARIAFNVSNLTTGNPAWLEALARTLTQHPEIASRMVVEITETAAQRNLAQTAYFVAEIQSYGAMVALDDFGSGYTSFRQLKSLSVDMVKIDGAFIKDMVDNADNRLFVRTLLTFTKSFGLMSVAEFVENGETAKMLMELGVDYLQGYYFGHPDTTLPWAASAS